MSSVIITLILIFSFLPAKTSMPILMNNYARISPQNGVLQGGISESKELPQGFYGTWQVTGEIIETNNPMRFSPKTSDIWTLEKRDKIITLTNPASGATASITVNDVKGNTATFTREKNENFRRENETPTITINGGNFTGTDTIIYERVVNGYVVKRDIVKYRVIGRKISGPTIEEIFSK